ncbi:hypothetical protein SAMN04490244_107168 [Tranquillimonas rosea]|uniref:Plasmid recombination enzyme n=1 Tax=Tranquillimonas rosea TaxID=641238 RepID=A0A1H9VJV7_9RHOB|nr:hypothetical protein [Tranquillimonas rosea]SES21882.1 hypothetical protein SAMN04490244_107168 [Tranquillimonas rosea]
MSEKKKHPIVFRFASVYPAALARIEMHAKRSGGPLENIELQFMHRNKVYVGPTFAEEMRAEIRAMKQQNFDEEVAACRARKRKKEAAAREEAGLIDPWHGNSQGPIREAIVTAHWEYFEAEDRSDPNDLLTTYGVDKNGEEVVHVLSKAKIEAFEKATLAFFDEYFPGSVRHLRMDLDEETPHFHAVIFETAEKTNKTRGTQRLIQPSAHPLLADYELLQDVAGEHYASIGLARGQKRAQEVREAKESELPLPDAVRHVSPREYRNGRARAIRAKELGVKQQERDLDLREANVFLDEVTADAKRAGAAAAEREAAETKDAAEVHLKHAVGKMAEANAYVDAVSEGLEAIIGHEVDYEPAEQDRPERLGDGPKARNGEEQEGLWSRIQPAYERLVTFARHAFRLRHRVFAARRLEADIARRAKAMAEAERAAGRPVGVELSAVLGATEELAYEVDDFPGAWAIPKKSDHEAVGTRLDEMSNKALRSCYLATRDAADISEEQLEVHDPFDRGRRVLELEAGRRGLNLETGRHDPKSASDPKRATLHTDQDTQTIKVMRRDDQQQRVRR